MGNLLYVCMAIGQCVCEPSVAYVELRPPIVYVATEHQVILNASLGRERFYAKIILPSGYRTEVPVINGCFPGITEFHYGSGVRLELDYVVGAKHYSKVRYVDGRVDYTRVPVIDLVAPSAILDSAPAPKPKPFAPVAPVATSKPVPATKPVAPVATSKPVPATKPFAPVATSKPVPVTKSFAPVATPVQSKLPPVEALPILPLISKDPVQEMLVSPSEVN